METLFWPLGLILLGFFLLLCEAFIPSGGILGVLTASALIAGVCMAFYTGGLATGTLFLVGTTLGVGAAAAVFVRWWPKTPMGRMILTDPQPAAPVGAESSSLRRLVGQVGQTRGLMLPSGVVDIEGRLYDAVTAAGAIEKGAWVQVSSVRDRNLVVRPIGDDVLDQLQAARTVEADAAAPLREEIPDPFADPLA